MLRSNAAVPTRHASRYLTRLCRHWRHKLSVEFTPETGRIEFGDGRVCTLTAAADHLAIELETPDEEAAARLEGVVADHLIRMADQDSLSEFAWNRG